MTAKKTTTKTTTTKATKPLVKKKVEIKGHKDFVARHERIAQLAYLMAEKRGFSGGDPVQDWLEAERLIDGQA